MGAQPKHEIIFSTRGLVDLEVDVFVPDDYECWIPLLLYSRPVQPVVKKCEKCGVVNYSIIGFQ